MTLSEWFLSLLISCRRGRDVSKLYVLRIGRYDDGDWDSVSEHKGKIIASAKAFQARYYANWSEIFEIDTDTLEFREVRFWDEEQA